jgi:hypothetical protein
LQPCNVNGPQMCDVIDLILWCTALWAIAKFLRVQLLLIRVFIQFWELEWIYCVFIYCCIVIKTVVNIHWQSWVPLFLWYFLTIWSIMLCHLLSHYSTNLSQFSSQDLMGNHEWKHDGKQCHADNVRFYCGLSQGMWRTLMTVVFLECNSMNADLMKYRFLSWKLFKFVRNVFPFFLKCIREVCGCSMTLLPHQLKCNVCPSWPCSQNCLFDG